jgi:Protein of unknown function (DUF1573)
MKYLITIVAALFIGLSANAQGAKISFTEETHNFGTVPKGPDAVYFFEFANTGDQPLIISKCAGSCECTKAKCPTAPVMPGAKAKIEVHFETKDKEGAFSKTVMIKCNATNVNKNVGAYEIFIKGNVDPKGAKGTKPAAKKSAAVVKKK